MSKYIRTKYRIFSEEQIRNTNHNEDGTELTWKDIERIVKWFTPDGKIERIADTIEELIDEVVLIQKVDNVDHYTILIINEEDKGKELKNAYVRNAKNNWYCSVIDYIEAKDTIYGAIWVVVDNKKPVLKSVAKMNAKGDLELL